eukprot:TRINITY_DN10495_c0_g1_i2.p1 TRINITY_DN10495_c0_g1~~TRINITY_DN10495_c0_g1_i2.p1  ORF type:complete len:545 (+),score=83.63 TRINITY_DN10495_c0_g1_i2:35-1669(+)
MASTGEQPPAAAENAAPAESKQMEPGIARSDSDYLSDNQPPLPCRSLTFFTPERRCAFNYFCQCLAFGLSAPAFPLLATKVTDSTKNASLLLGVSVGIRSLLAVFTNPSWGHISDHFGRKPVLAISNLASVFSFFMLSQWQTEASVFLSAIVIGVFGAGFPISFAMMADLKCLKQAAEERSPTKRYSTQHIDPYMVHKSFGILGFAMGIGFVFGPVSGGVIAEKNSLSTTFASAAVVSLFGIIFNVLALGETVTDAYAEAHELSCASALHAAFAKFRRIWKNIKGSAKPLLFVVLFCYSMSQGAVMIMLIYTDRELGWGTLTNGLFLSYLGLLVLFVQLMGTIYALPKIGERKVMVICLSMSMASFFLFGLHGATWLMFVGAFIGAPGSLFESTLKGALSKAIPGQDQGQLQGALEAVDGMGRVFGPVMAALVYGHTDQQADHTHHADGGERAFWFASAAWSTLGLLLLLCAVPPCNTGADTDAREIADSLKAMDGMVKTPRANEPSGIVVGVVNSPKHTKSKADTDSKEDKDDGPAYGMGDQV